MDLISAKGGPPMHSPRDLARTTEHQETNIPFSLDHAEALIRCLTQTEELHHLLQRVWIFEEDTMPIIDPRMSDPLYRHDGVQLAADLQLPRHAQLAIASDQLCVMLPVLETLTVSTLPVSSLARAYATLFQNPLMQWSVCRDVVFELGRINQGPSPDNTWLQEGYARITLFCAKMLHLQEMLQLFTSIDQLWYIRRAMRSFAVDAPFPLQRQCIGALQLFAAQSFAQPEILLACRSALEGVEQRGEQIQIIERLLQPLHMGSNIIQLGLIEMLTAVSEEELQLLHMVLVRMLPHHLSMLVLLLRKPQSVVVDAWSLSRKCFALIADEFIDYSKVTHIPQDLNENQKPTDADGLKDEQPSSSETPGTFSSQQHGSPIRLVITTQPPKEIVKDRLLNPGPCVRLEGSLLDSAVQSFIIRVSAMREGEYAEIEDCLCGNTIISATSRKTISFKKIKVRFTCKQLHCNAIVLRFQLLRQEPGRTFSDVGVEAISDAIEVFSHTSQLHIQTKIDTRFSIAGLVPSVGSASGGTRVAILASNLISVTELMVLFGGVSIMPEAIQTNCVVFQTPPLLPDLARNVYVQLSSDGKTALGEACGIFTYID
eukprot:TRINITY_DN10055_c0_g1_i1.p1 TRINITY_DN10055_c0_g1~~TRINITY_DN10055_c0_g1_i1.p1  ORF type:complete len:601 (+),score=109.16 TRINITY_DN10055_c0_g1_i1:149-1951(+)